MVMKTLTIKEKVYKTLVSVKDKNESFSDLLERLAVKEKKSVTEFAGFLSEKSGNEMMAEWKKNRAKSKADIGREKRLEALWSS